MAAFKQGDTVRVIDADDELYGYQGEILDVEDFDGAPMYQVQFPALGISTKFFGTELEAVSE